MQNTLIRDLESHHFQRPDLVVRIVQDLTGQIAFSDGRNGIFLAAPRRTGKTAFLRNELMPALEQLQLVVIYTDLWSNPDRDPRDVIGSAIGKTLRAHHNLLTKAIKAANLKQISIGGVQVDLSRIGQSDGLDMAEALSHLINVAGAPVVLIVDEAQHALSTKGGINAMLSLKSARDQINNNPERKTQLMLLMTGSDRDKLARLVHSYSGPFFGSEVQHMPELGSAFISDVANLVEEGQPRLAPLDRQSLLQSLTLFRHRPQPFLRALSKVLRVDPHDAMSLDKALSELATEHRRGEESEIAAMFLGLSTLERAITSHMLAAYHQGHVARPYDADAFAVYTEWLGTTPTLSQVQKAIERLRTHNPPVVWRSTNSEYAIDDVAMHPWFSKRLTDGTWPPTAAQGHSKPAAADL
jgi:hypothetical protein